MKLDWIISLISALGGAKGIILLVASVSGLGIWQGVENYFNKSHVKNMEAQVTELAGIVARVPRGTKVYNKSPKLYKDCNCQGLIDKYAKEHKDNDH